VLKLALVLVKRAHQPNAEFAAPPAAAAFASALVPSAVQSAHVLAGSGVSGAGAACATGESAKQANTGQMTINIRFFIDQFPFVVLCLFYPSVNPP
jgi:hypothetical protein